MIPQLLIVSATAGFRHGSIEIAEAALQQMARRDGRWTLDYLRQPADGDLAGALAKLDATHLGNYAGVIFLSTSGELPLPNRDGFLRWIAAGHAFIGVHAATDTFLNWAAYQEMTGAKFSHHGAQTSATVRVADTAHPATHGLGDRWHLELEEIYQFENYRAGEIHELLVLDHSPEDATPGHFPIAWTKFYQEGRIFYTSLGHREDFWSEATALPERVNSPAVSRQFMEHLRGGIAWALGL